MNKFWTLGLVTALGLAHIQAQVRSGGASGGTAANGSFRAASPNNGTSTGTQNGLGTQNNFNANNNAVDTTGNANVNSSTANNGTDANGQPIPPLNNNLKGIDNPITGIAGQDRRMNFRGTNRFFANTNGLNAFNSNRFGFGTNQFGVVTNRFGAATNQVGRFGFGGTNGNLTPTSNRGTNRFYGTNTFQGTQNSGLRDQAFTPSDQALLTHIQQTVDPKLGIVSLDNSPVHFLVQENNVTLMGFASSPEQKALIVSMVKGVPGVVSVQDNLVVGAALGVNGANNNNAGGNLGVSGQSIDGIPNRISLNPANNSSGLSAGQQQLNIGTNGVTGAGAPIGEPPAVPVPPAPNAVPQQ